MTLRIGRIAYTNLFPIFYALENEADCSSYEFIDGVPSDLNRRLHNGDIDISPSSSIEYLKHRDQYTLVTGHSISSFGRVGSVLLFSKRPIEALDGMTILTSSQSETSVALLAIILRKFLGITCFLKSTREPLDEVLRSHDACLIIGDDAIKEALRRPELLMYDLGDLWYRHTGMPMVFALWIMRNSSLEHKPNLLRQFMLDLDQSKKSALGNYAKIAKHSWLKQVISPAEIVSYWEGISYDLGEEHRKGLELFSRYAEELGLIHD